MSYTKLRPAAYTYTQVLLLSPGGQSILDQRTFDSSSSFTGTYLPQWKSLIKGGQGATTPASGVQVDVLPSFIDFSMLIRHRMAPHPELGSQVIGDTIPYGYGSGVGAVPSSIVTDVTNRAIRKYLAACESVRSSVELGQDIGEIKQTIAGIRHPLKSLRDFTSAHLSKVLKLTKKAKTKHTLSKIAADSFLEYKFGWAPIASDIADAYVGLTNNSRFNVASVHGGAFATWPISTQVGIATHSAGIFSIQTNRHVTGSYFVGFKGGMRTGAVNGRTSFAQMMQLDLPHFVPTIWDLLPYSWIADYFINIGEIINGLCFQASNLAWTNRTVRITQDFSYSNILVPNYDPVGYEKIYSTASGGTSVISNVVFQRSGINAWDLVPTLQIKLPLGSEKPWENMLALMVGRQKDVTRVARNIR